MDSKDALARAKGEILWLTVSDRLLRLFGQALDGKFYGLIQLFDKATSALCHVRATSAATLKPRARVTHQGVHVAGSIRRAREDQTRSINITRAEESNSLRVSDERKREFLQRLRITIFKTARTELHVNAEKARFGKYLFRFHARGYIFEGARAACQLFMLFHEARHSLCCFITSRAEHRGDGARRAI